MKHTYKVPSYKAFVIETEETMITASGSEGLDGVGNGGNTHDSNITEADTRKQSLWNNWDD